MSYDIEDPNQNWLGRYVRLIADDFGLRDWSFDIVAEDPDEEDFLAQIKPVCGRKYAQIHVRGDFFSKRAESSAKGIAPDAVGHEERQRSTIVHELLHCHFAQMQCWCEGHMKPTALEAWLLFHETGIDGVAEAIAEKFPLPAVVREEKAEQEVTS